MTTTSLLRDRLDHWFMPTADLAAVLRWLVRSTLRSARIPLADNRWHVLNLPRRRGSAQQAGRSRGSSPSKTMASSLTRASSSSRERALAREMAASKA